MYEEKLKNSIVFEKNGLTNSKKHVKIILLNPLKVTVENDTIINQKRVLSDVGTKRKY